MVMFNRQITSLLLEQIPALLWGHCCKAYAFPDLCHFFFNKEEYLQPYKISEATTGNRIFNLPSTFSPGHGIKRMHLTRQRMTS